MSTNRNPGPLGQPRGIGFGILLFIVTLGFYSWYWAFKTHEEIRQHSGEGLGGVLGLVVWILISPVSAFVIPSEIGKMYEKDGREAPVTGWTGLWLFPGGNPDHPGNRLVRQSTGLPQPVLGREGSARRTRIALELPCTLSDHLGRYGSAGRTDGSSSDRALHVVQAIRGRGDVASRKDRPRVLTERFLPSFHARDLPRLSRQPSTARPRKGTPDGTEHRFSTAAASNSLTVRPSRGYSPTETMDADNGLRLDYEQTTQLLRTLVDVRFKLLAFVPTVAAAAVGAGRPATAGRPAPGGRDARTLGDPGHLPCTSSGTRSSRTRW